MIILSSTGKIYARPTDRICQEQILPIEYARTASLLISLREAARKVPNFAQPIILAYGTYASAKISRHSVAAWLYGVLRKKRINGAKALTPP